MIVARTLWKSEASSPLFPAIRNMTGTSNIDYSRDGNTPTVSPEGCFADR